MGVFTLNRYVSGSALLAMVMFWSLMAVPAQGAVYYYNTIKMPRDTTKQPPKDSAKKKLHGFDFSLSFESRQTYYGSYTDSEKLRCLSPEIDYMFRNGIVLSFSTTTLSKTSRVISEIGLGIDWNYIINDDWFGVVGYSRYISTLPANTVVLRKQNAVSNDVTTSLENDNYILNTSLRFDILGGGGGARDFVFDLQNSHDFDIVYKNPDHYLSIGLQNDLFFGSVNSLSYINRTVIETRRRKITIQASQRTSGVLYDNIALPLTLQMKRVAIVPELDCSIGNKTFTEIKTLVPPAYYPPLNKSPLLYFAVTLDYNLQKKTARK